MRLCVAGAYLAEFFGCSKIVTSVLMELVRHLWPCTGLEECYEGKEL